MEAKDAGRKCFGVSTGEISESRDGGMGQGAGLLRQVLQEMHFS